MYWTPAILKDGRTGGLRTRKGRTKAKPQKGPYHHFGEIVTTIYFNTKVFFSLVRLIVKVIFSSLDDDPNPPERIPAWRSERKMAILCFCFFAFFTFFTLFKSFLFDQRRCVVSLSVLKIQAFSSFRLLRVLSSHPPTHSLPPSCFFSLLPHFLFLWPVKAIWLDALLKELFFDLHWKMLFTSKAFIHTCYNVACFNVDFFKITTYCIRTIETIKSVLIEKPIIEI